jgi:hypothetical protein
MGKEQQKPTGPSLSQLQLWENFKQLQQQLKELKDIVSRLKEILLTGDNWHSKIVKWIGKDVFFNVNPAEDIQETGTVGKLLWADRYHIGVEIMDRQDPKIVREHLINKGHIVHIREA